MENGLNLFLIIIGKFGFLGNWLFLFIAMLECIPFIGGFFPGGTLISIGAFLAAQGYFNIFDILLYAICGAIVGDYLAYLSGRWGGAWLIKKNIIKPELLAKGEEFFKKYGTRSILWGRFLGATRAIIPFFAGVSKMKHRYFMLWNIAGAIIWALFAATIGYFSGNIFFVVIKKWSHKLSLVLTIVIIGGIIYWLFNKHGQSFIDYFKKQSRLFSQRIFNSRLLDILDDRYPEINEFSKTNKNQAFFFSLFLWLTALVGLYALTFILDLF